MREDFDVPLAPFTTMAVGGPARRVVTAETIDEIVDAVRSLIDAKAHAGVAAKDMAPEITVESISEHLYTSGQPDPDLVIRTSGEQRLSNFLLWQSAYAELVVQDVLWADVDRRTLWEAVGVYARRDRRYGGAVDRVAGPGASA